MWVSTFSDTFSCKNFPITTSQLSWPPRIFSTGFTVQRLRSFWDSWYCSIVCMNFSCNLSEQHTIFAHTNYHTLQFICQTLLTMPQIVSIYRTHNHSCKSFTIISYACQAAKPALVWQPSSTYHWHHLQVNSYNVNWSVFFWIFLRWCVQARALHEDVFFPEDVCFPLDIKWKRYGVLTIFSYSVRTLESSLIFLYYLQRLKYE